MNSYQAMLMAAQRAQGGQQQTMGQPVHHILEEKQGPSGSQVVGSSWRHDAEAQMNDWRQRAQDPGLPLAIRKHYNSLANQLQVDIGEEDAYHHKENETGTMLEGDDAFARLQQRRNQARGGMDQSAPTGLTPAQAQRKGWIPPR